MKLNKTLAKAVATVSMTMAKKACGAASMYGFYQPKEPKAVAKIK